MKPLSGLAIVAGFILCIVGYLHYQQNPYLGDFDNQTLISLWQFIAGIVLILLGAWSSRKTSIVGKVATGAAVGASGVLLYYTLSIILLLVVLYAVFVHYGWLGQSW